MNSLITFIRSCVIWKRVHDFQLRIESYHIRVNLTAPMIIFASIEAHDPYSIVDKPNTSLIYLNNKEEKRVMYLAEIVKFYDATLERVLKEVKLKIFKSRPWKKPHLMGEFDLDILKAYEREITNRLRHRVKMRKNRNGHGNGNGSHSDRGSGNRRTVHTARGCTYKEFLNFHPLNFQVKYATCTLLDGALTWWNSHVKTVGIDAAYDMSWKDLTKMITELALLCPKMVPDEDEKIERTVDGVETSVPPTTAEQKLARKNELKAREDVNLKLLRSLSSEWKTHILIWRNKPDLEDLSMDDFTNEAVKTAHGVSATNSKNNASTLPNVDSLSDAVIYSFFACQSNSSQLDNEDLKKINPDDLEEMDLKWKMAMLTIRERRFLNKIGRNLGVNGTDTIGFDKTKVECYNCHRTGHFGRECRAPKNQDSRNRETTRRIMPVEETTSNALVSQCDGFGSDTEVSTCSIACLKSYETLKEHYDNLTKDFNKSQLNVGAYKAGLESVEARLDMYKKNEAVSEEDIKILKHDIMLRDNALTELRKKFEKAKKERDDLKLTLEKTGVGYDSQVFDSQMNDKYKSGEGYHVVPSPYTGNFMPPKPDLVLVDKDEYIFSKSVTSVPAIATSRVKTKKTRESVKKVENYKQAEYPRKNCQSPRDCDYHEKKMVEKPVWNNATRVDHQNSQRITHLHPKRNFVPRAVLMKSGLKTLNTARQNSSRAAVSVSTARPINTAYPRPTVNSVRPVLNVFNRAHSHDRRPFNKFTINKNSNFNEKVNTIRGNVTTVGPKAVGNPQQDLKDIGVIDSRCSRHMIGNKSYLTYYEEIGGGFVSFGGNSKGGKITGKDFKLTDESLISAVHVFQVTPKVLHLHAVKRIFRYLKGQPKLGLWYPKDSPFNLEAYTDSDYAGASLDKKSITGGCQFLGSRLISWQCKKQTMVANSTTEAEYIIHKGWLKWNATSAEDGIEVKTESSVRRDLHFNDEDVEPKKVIQALKDPRWIEAMQEELLQFKLQQVWTLVDLPYGKRSIGLQVTRTDDGIFISQDKYVDEEVWFFNCEDSKPDIMFVVCAYARVQVTPKLSHLHVVKRIFRYLKGQPKLGLWYPKDSPFDLEAYTDSDYAGASIDRKSTTGGCQFLRSRLISWQCKKKTMVANSTTEAEYVAASNYCGQIKHIEIRHHFIRDSNEKKLIQMSKIHTDQNVADLLTKAFDDVEWNATTAEDRIEVKTGNSKVNAVGPYLVLLGKS
ncbi:putative ribonuclease H-like domain-containing protein [Tanacetum coccineum]